MRLMEREGYILAAATGILYLMAYLRVLAEASFYDVPIEMMSFDFFQLTQGVIGILVLLSGMMFGAFIAFWLFRVNSRRSVFLYFSLMVFVMPSLIYIWFRGENKTTAIVFSVLFFVVFVALFIVMKKLRALDVTSSIIFSDCKDFLSYERVRFLLIGVLLVILMLTAYISSYVGVSSLKNYNVFYIKGYYAVVNASPDGVIAKKVINKELGHGFYIFSVEEINSIEIRKANIETLPTIAPPQSGESRVRAPLPVGRI